MEFLEKLKYFIEYNIVMNDIKNNYSKKLKTTLSPTMEKLLNDYNDIIKDQNYEKKEFNIEELKEYDNIIISMNHKNYDYEVKKHKFTNIIKELLQKLQFSFSKYVKIFYAMIIFKILETDIGERIIQDSTQFKYTVYKKIEEFKKDSLTKFVEYFDNNYDTYKKYISKSRNKRYYLRKLRTIIFSFYVFSDLYKKVKNKNLQIKNTYHENCIIN